MTTGLLILSTLFAAEPVSISQPAAAKVYVVYVTVIEVDADGGETVIFTPKLQTTGNPAGVAVEHKDGRSFEFNCKLTTADGLALERPPVGKRPATITPVRSTVKKEAASIPAERRDEFYVRTYDVSDLLETADSVGESDFAPLLQTLKTVAVPESWSGKATIKPFASTKSLVIKQNAVGHEAVVAALKELRPRTIDEK